MDPHHLDVLFSLLPSGTTLDPGLTDAEVASIEESYGFRFPPDLRAFLQRALPVGGMWVDWRHATPEELRKRLDRPIEGLVGDVPWFGWLDDWGPKPADANEAREIARQHALQAPRMIPIYAHRYMPDEPCLPGNPVFSMMQSDIIQYGNDLADYFAHEFRIASGVTELPDWAAKQPRPIRFWDDLL